MLQSYQITMQIRYCYLLVLFLLLFVTISPAQPKNYEIKNAFQIGGGLTYFNMITDNFETQQNTGFVVSAGIGAPLPHKWYDISYNFQILNNKFDIDGRVSDDVTGNEWIEYEMFGVQAGLVFHINIIGSNLTLDVGPQLAYNSDLEVKDSSMENYFLNNYEMLRANDITDINNFNINGMAGVSAGFGPLKFRAQYIYGVLNSFDKLNELGEGNDFKANPSYVTLAAFLLF